MSRGLGELQRFVLEQLESRRGWIDVGWLAYRRYGDGRPTAAQVESLRRAVRTLAARGLVETQRNPGNNSMLEVRRRPVA
jgi:hypothetical protein